MTTDHSCKLIELSDLFRIVMVGGVFLVLDAHNAVSAVFCSNVLPLKGGMRAVIWTDVFQCMAMVVGMLVIMIKVRSMIYYDAILNYQHY